MISIHEELEYVNQNLENIIAERTSELNNSNKELKQSLEMKDKIFSIEAMMKATADPETREVIRKMIKTKMVEPHQHIVETK